MRKIELPPAGHRIAALASGKAAWLVSLFLIALLMAPRFAAPQSLQANQSKTEKTDMVDGKQTFERHCAVCHAIDGGGGYTYFNPQTGHELSAVITVMTFHDAPIKATSAR